MKLRVSVIFFFIFTIFSVAGFCNPLSGVYTIGGSSPSYTTFAAAVSDLVSNGVSGAVTFKVRSGTYDEQISIPAITGASATNRITFGSESGNVADVTLQFSNTSTENYVIEFDGASYITIQNMTLASTEPTFNYGQVIVFTNQCDYDKILNNTLNGLPVTSWYTSANVISAYCPSTGLVVEGNTINYGTMSMIWLGKDNTPGGLMNCSVVKNNIMLNAYEWSMAIGYQNNSVLEGNTCTSNSNNLNLGMQIQDVVNPLLICNNKFSYDNTFCVLYIVNNHPTDLAHGVTVANNFFSLGGNCSAMYLINDEYSKIYYNSVYSKGNGQGFVDYGNSKGTVLANNIFYESTGAATMNIASGSIASSDYNDLYTTGATLVQWNSVNQSNLVAWQSASGFDTHSTSVVPPFTSFADLHLTNYPSMQFGTPIAEIPADIDNRRRGTSPAVGADDNGTVNYTGNTTSCGGVSIQPEFTTDYTIICAGSAVQFTDQTNNSPTGWLWTFSGGTPGSSNTPDPSVIYKVAGTYDVKLVVSNSSGKDSLTKTGYITVNPLPAAGKVTGPDTICAGNAIELNDTSSSGAIQWQSSANSLTFTDINGDTTTKFSIAYPGQTTFYRVKASGICGSDSTAPFKLFVNQLPSPIVSASDSIICASDSARICSSGAFASYHWNTNGTSSCIITAQAGGYWLTVTDSNGCSAVSNHQDISVYPVPSVSIVVQGDTMASYNAVAYQWRLNDTVIAGATAAILVAKQSGDYSVQVTDSSGCVAISNSIHIDVTDVYDLSTSPDIQVYPNPFSHYIFVRANSLNSVEVYDLLGRTVFSRIYKKADYTIQINLSDLPNGMYLLKIKSGEANYLQKIINELK